MWANTSIDSHFSPHRDDCDVCAQTAPVTGDSRYITETITVATVMHQP